MGRDPLSPAWWADESTAEIRRYVKHYEVWALRKDTIGCAARVLEVLRKVLAERESAEMQRSA